MQTLRHFPAKDKKVIEVVVNSAPRNKTAVLIVYGLSGTTDQSMFHNAAQLFPRKGLDVWRIRLFGWHKGARTMLAITWEQMMADIHTALRAMAREYKNISLIGHSMGGAQLPYIDHPAVKAKVLWDPACVKDVSDYRRYKKLFRKNPLNPRYRTLNWGAICMAPKKLINVANERYWFAKNLKRLPKKQPPLLVVRASIYGRVGWAQDVLPAKVVVVPHSDHCFTLEDGQNQKDLFRHTLGFIKAHAK